MLKCVAGLALSMFVLSLAVSSLPAKAAEEAAKKTTVTGVVEVVKDDKGEVTAVQVKAGDKVQKLVLDDKSKEVAKLAGKKVEVTGTVGADGALKVESFKEVVEKKAE